MWRRHFDVLEKKNCSGVTSLLISQTGFVGWPQISAAESVHDWESREERRSQEKHVMRVREKKI